MFLTLGISFSASAQQNCPLSGNLGYDHQQNFSSCDIDLSEVDIKEIRVIYHVFQKDDGSENIPNTAQGRGFLWNFHSKTNQGFNNMPVMSMPTASPHIVDSKIRLDRVNRYFWKDNDMWALGNRFSSSHGQQLYDFVMAQNVPGKHTALHIMIPGNFGAPNVGGRASGIGCLQWSMVEDLYAKYLDGNNFWDHAGILRHEVGHNLSLHHVWFNDYCNDTNGHNDLFNQGSVDNNLMGENTAQNSMTIDQATRCHHFLHNNQWVLSSGQDLGIMSGTISQSGNNGNMNTVNNVNSSTASVTIHSQPGTLLNWVKQSGSGSFSSSNSGHTLSISNLGSISLMATWEENCLNYSRTVAFYNQPSWRLSFDQEENLMTLAFGAESPAEQIIIEPFDYKVEIIDPSGNVQLTSIVHAEDFTLQQNLKMPSLESGIYTVRIWIDELVSTKQVLLE